LNRKQRETQARKKRAWREVARITGAGLYSLPSFFANGLYRLLRSGLPDAEILRAYERCQAWAARAKDGIGQCECGCETKRPVNAVNLQGQSVWHLDHDPHRKTFRGVLFERCNRELGDGDRARKFAHASYTLAHEARLPDEAVLVRDGDEFQAAGAVD